MKETVAIVAILLYVALCVVFTVQDWKHYKEHREKRNRLIIFKKNSEMFIQHNYSQR